jgi:glycosyltransferase involved in cell wall biosynthesis
MNKVITIDIRKIHDSGIGTYIVNLVPKVIDALPDVKFYLLVQEGEVKQYEWMHQPKVTLIEIKSRLLSPGEQIELPQKIPQETSLYWATQFNIPVLYKGKLLVTVHDIIHIAKPKLVGGLHHQLYVKFMLSAIRLKNIKILTVSRFTEDELVRLVGIKRDNTQTTYAGVGDRWFQVTKKQNPYPKPYLLFVGNVKPNKNLKGLLGAFKLIMEKIPHDLIIVGRKEGMITMDKTVMAEADTFFGRVQFTGYIDNEMLEQYFVHADALVFPSFYEGFGIPPLEAMACGCPIVVSNVASLPEVCQDAVLYCDPYSERDIANQILRIVTDKQLRSSLIEKGKIRATELTYARCVNETVKVIKECIGDENYSS